MKKITILLSLILGLTIFPTNYLKAQATPEELMEPFFAIFAEDVNQAIDYLFESNPLIDGNQDGIKSIKERLELSRKLLGNYHGHEIVNIYHAGDSYAKYVYSLKYERQPVKFELVLYKAKNTWKVQNINFQDDIDTEFRIRE